MIFNLFIRFLPFFCLCFVLQGCMSTRSYDEDCCLTAVNVIDRNGLSETVSSKERLEQYENIDFLKPQPYQKVLRVFERNAESNVNSVITTYHDSGQPKQYLEVVNSRALGKYREWYPNGTLKLEANVIGGAADVTPTAEQSWIFDGTNHVWDEQGNLQATIQYEKGSLHGDSLYYHRNGQLWKKFTYCNNTLEGASQILLEDGTLFQETNYKSGLKEGLSRRYWKPDLIASEEAYQSGLLEKGLYYDCEGTLIAEIVSGEGERIIFSKEGIAEIQEYHRGVCEGKIKMFDSSGRLIRIYTVKEGAKHGEEIEYYEVPPFCKADQYPLKPKIMIHWHEGKIQGVVKTWYDNGQIESQREISANVKNGMLSAWYRNGNLMLIEEYDHDLLSKGEYYRLGERSPVSTISNGKGVATIFDPEGHFLKKINYQQGRPLD